MSQAEQHLDRASQLSVNRLGLWLFFASESMIFIDLLATRYYLVGVSRPPDLNQWLALAITVLLLTSVLTANLARAALAQGRMAAFQRDLLATIGMGLLFIVGVGLEWSGAAFSIHSGYGSVFFTTTGVHAAHVLSGVVVLALILLQARRGRYTREDDWGVRAAILYWSFVDLVWVFLYPTLYLVR